MRVRCWVAVPVLAAGVAGAADGARDVPLEKLVGAARKFHARYAAAGDDETRADVRRKIVALFEYLSEREEDEAVDAMARFFDFPELAGRVTESLVDVGTDAAREAIGEALARDPPSPPEKRQGLLRTTSRRMAILDACRELEGRLPARSVKRALQRERDLETVREVLDFLAPRCGAREAAAVVAALDDAAGSSAISKLLPRERERLFVEFFRRTFRLTRPGEGGEAVEEEREELPYVRDLDDREERAIREAFLGVARSAGRSRAARVVALRVLALRGDPRTAEVLRGIWKDEADDRRLVLAATRAAMDLGDPAAGEGLGEVLASWMRRARRDAVLRDDLAELVEAAGALRLEAAAPTVRKLLRTRLLHLRTAAVVALPVLPQERAERHLRRALGHKHWRVRLAAIEACRRLRAPWAVERLIEHMPEERGRLRYDLLMALHELSGTAMPYVPEDWEKWWSTIGDGWTPPEEHPEDGDAKTVVLFPEADPSTYFGMRVLSRRLAFVLDVSGSMSASMEHQGEERPRIDVLKQELLDLIRSFQGKTWFNIWFFDSAHRTLFDHLVVLTRSNYGKVQDFVEGARARGGTNLYDPLEEALGDPYVDTIWLLSDGDPSAGKLTEEEEILRAVRRLNRRAAIRIHTISIGQPSSLLRRLAEQNGGEYRELQ